MNCFNNGHKHDCGCNDDEYDYPDSYSEICGNPDPCAERWAREQAQNRKAKKQTAVIALVIGLTAVAVAAAFFLISSGIVVFDNGNDDGKASNGVVNNSNDGPAKVIVNTDKIGIETDKIVIDKDKKDYKDKHDKDDD